MTTESVSIRTRWAAIGAAIAVTLGGAGIGGYNLVNADSQSSQAVYTAITPCRITDIRPDQGIGGRTTPLAANETMSIATKVEDEACAGQIPGEANAVTLNVTATHATQKTFLTIFPGGDAPNASTLNPVPGEAATVNGASTALDTPGGSFSVRNESGEVNIIIDVTGYYADHNHDAHNDARNDERYEAIPTQVVLAGFDFDLERGDDEWSTDGAWWYRDAGFDQCLVAAVDLPSGRKVVGFNARTIASAPAEVSVYLLGRFSGPGSYEGPVVTDPIVDDVSTTGFNDISVREILATSFEIEPDAVASDDYSYSLVVCSADEVELTSVAIDLI